MERNGVWLKHTGVLIVYCYGILSLLQHGSALAHPVGLDLWFQWTHTVFLLLIISNLMYTKPRHTNQSMRLLGMGLVAAGCSMEQAGCPIVIHCCLLVAMVYLMHILGRVQQWPLVPFLGCAVLFLLLLDRFGFFFFIGNVSAIPLFVWKEDDLNTTLFPPQPSFFPTETRHAPLHSPQKVKTSVRRVLVQ